MRLTYDPETDAAYIAFKEPRGEVTTIRLNQDTAVDLGQGEEVVGIELLAASKHLASNEDNPVVQLQIFTAA